MVLFLWEYGKYEWWVRSTLNQWHAGMMDEYSATLCSGRGNTASGSVVSQSAPVALCSNSLLQSLARRHSSYLLSLSVVLGIKLGPHASQAHVLLLSYISTLTNPVWTTLSSVSSSHSPPWCFVESPLLKLEIMNSDTFRPIIWLLDEEDQRLVCLVWLQSL